MYKLFIKYVNNNF